MREKPVGTASDKEEERMYTIGDLQNGSRKIVDQKGRYQLLELVKDPSVWPSNATAKYFMDKMNVHKRQVICAVDGNHYPPIILQAGAMQWMAGNVQVSTGVQGAGDLIGKMVRGSVTGESAIKPVYNGVGMLALEPTYKHILFEDVASWGPAGVVLEDGMFLACDGSIQHSIARRSTFSSAAAGGEGLFNLCLTGQGVAVLESYVPRSELVTVELNNDQLKVDGPYALMWSGSLQFSVERTTRTLVGSAASGEGFVNVYRGTGKVVMCPTAGKSSFMVNAD